MGYEYVTKKTYDAAQLRALGTMTQYYSWIDGYPAPVMMAAEGVPLQSIIRDAGIDPGSVQRYYFRAGDGHEAYAEFTSKSLFYDERYWYPNLTSTWDRETGKPGVGAGEGAQKTTTMIALKEYHERFLEAPREDLMYDAAGFRLVYGAAFVGDPYASFHDSVHSITHIDVQLVGSPPEDPKPGKDDTLVGSDPSNNTTGSGNDDASGTGKGEGDGAGTGLGTGSGNGGSADTAGTSSGAGEGVGAGESGIPGSSVSASSQAGAKPQDKPMAIDVGENSDTSLAVVGEIKTSGGTLVSGRDIEGIKVLMEIQPAGGGGGGGKSDGDDPWNKYEVAEDAGRLALPYSGEAAAATAVLCALAFFVGALVQGETFGRRKQ